MPKRKLLPQVPPIEAVFLCIDPSKHSSGAVLLEPNYDNDTGAFDGTYERLLFGVVKHLEQELRAEYVSTGIEAAKEMKVPFVVVAEDWTPGGDRMTFPVILALGESWGLWEAEILRQAPNTVVVRYVPAEWRELAFTWRYPKGHDAVKLFAINHIKSLWGFEVSEDIAEAACISEAAVRSGEVAELLAKAQRPKTRKKPTKKLK